jgi:hypothetical protein
MEASIIFSWAHPTAHLRMAVTQLPANVNLPRVLNAEEVSHLAIVFAVVNDKVSEFARFE